MTTSQAILAQMCLVALGIIGVGLLLGLVLKQLGLA
jgi:hypothetical protein